MLDLGKFETDLDKEINGTWEELEGDAKLLIARAGNPNYQRLYRAIPAGVRQAIDDDRVTDDEVRKHIATLLSETVLLDWDGLTVNGKEIKYTKEKAYEILADPKYKNFSLTVTTLARDQAVFAVKQEDTNVKNSPATSDGS